MSPSPPPHLILLTARRLSDYLARGSAPPLPIVIVIVIVSDDDDDDEDDTDDEDDGDYDDDEFESRADDIN